MKKIMIVAFLVVITVNVFCNKEKEVKENNPLVKMAILRGRA